MAALVFAIAIVIVAALAFVMAVKGVRRHPLVGLGSVGLILISMWEVPNLPAIVTVSGISIYPVDLVTLVLFAVGVLEVTQLQKNLGGWLFPWLLFGMTIAVSTVRGAAAFGPGTAVNEARGLLYFFFAMTWVLATRPDRLRMHTFSLGLGWALVLVALYHGATYGVGGATSAVAVGDVGVQTGRILNAGQAQALLLCAGTLFLVPVGSKMTRQRSTVSSIVFLGVVILAQHRSVWAAAALGVAAVLIWTSRSRARSQVFVLFVVAAWLAFLGWSLGFQERIGSELVDSTSNATTLSWRTSSWQSLISQAFDNGPTVIIGGEPFGGGFLRQLDTGMWTEAAAHSWYVTIFLRTGILGLAALAVMLISAVGKSRPVQAGWTFALVATCVYGFGYSVEWYLVPWLGVAMSVSLGGLLNSERIGWDQDKRSKVPTGVPRLPQVPKGADSRGVRKGAGRPLASVVSIPVESPMNRRTDADRYFGGPAGRAPSASE